MLKHKLKTMTVALSSIAMMPWTVSANINVVNDMHVEVMNPPQGAREQEGGN